MTDNEAYRVPRLYFEVRITRDDEKALYTYIRQDETSLALFREWEEEWEAVHEDSESTHKAWRRLTENLRCEGNVEKDFLHYDNGKDNPKKKIYSLYRRAAVAAIVIIAFGVDLLAMKLTINRPEQYYAFTAPQGSTARFDHCQRATVAANSHIHHT